MFSPFSELGTCNFVKHDWDWSDPRTILGVPSPPLSGGCPLLAVSGSSRGWPARVSSSRTWEARMWSAIAGVLGTGAVCSRLSPPVRGPHGGRGYTCRTPPWPAPLAASPTQPVGEFVVAELAVSSWAWRVDTHALSFRRRWTHWVTVVYQQRTP